MALRLWSIGRRCWTTTNAYALTSAEVDFGSQPGDWFPSGRLAAVRLDVESMATIEGDDRDPEPAPVFVRIGRHATPGVTVATSAGARTELLVPVAVALILGGLFFAGLAAILLVGALRQSGNATSPVAAAEPALR